MEITRTIRFGFKRRTSRFYETLAKQLAKNTSIKLCVLELGGQPIAYEYLIAFNNKLLVAKHSYNDTYKKYSPGIILRYEIFKKLISEFRFIDTWGSKDEFKMIWCTNVVERFLLTIKKGCINNE